MSYYASVLKANVKGGDVMDDDANEFSTFCRR
jgi:hypothetical protein